MGTTKTDVWAGRYDVRTPFIATGSGALAETISYGKAMEIEEVRIKVGVAPTTAENMTITLDSGDGAAYDVLLKTIPMAGVTSYVWVIDKPSLVLPGDAIVISWANTDTKTWGLTVVYRRVN